MLWLGLGSCNWVRVTGRVRFRVRAQASNTVEARARDKVKLAVGLRGQVINRGKTRVRVRG